MSASSWGPRNPGVCSREVVWLAARGLVMVALAVVLFVAMACQKPARTDDGISPRDCGESSADCEGQDG